MDALEYAVIGADTLMNRFTAEELPPTDRFHYHQGVFLEGVDRVYKVTGDKKYRDYIKAWVDFNVDADGNIPTCHTDEFDDIQPGLLLFDLSRDTGDMRYKKPLDLFAKITEEWPVNSEGAVWHKYLKPYQMWLDCMYMMGVITTRYAFEFDRPDLFEIVHTFMSVMRSHMTNPETGLLYHMYDESRTNPFVDENGLIKVHWARAISWVTVTMAEILEIIPENHKYRSEFLDLFVSLMTNLKKYQDEKTGMWYQVADRPNDPRNWTETSATALIAYSAAKGVRLGCLDESFRSVAMRGYEGELTQVKIENGKMDISGICVGTGVGPLGYYLNRPTSSNDLHGMGAFLMLTAEIHRLENGI